jgi:hypothetical protein
MRRMNVAVISTALSRAESGGDRKALQPKICAPRKNTLAIINTHFFSLSKYPYSKKRRGWRGYKGLILHKWAHSTKSFVLFIAEAAFRANRTRFGEKHREAYNIEAGVCAHEPVSTHSSMLSAATKPVKTVDWWRQMKCFVRGIRRGAREWIRSN